MKRICSLVLSIGIALSGVAGCAHTPLESGETQAPSAGSEIEPSPPPASALPEAPPPPSPQPEEEPVDNAWEFAPPESDEIDRSSLEEIHQKLAGSQMLGVVIVKDGVLVDEWYQDGYDADSVFHMHSVTKSVMGSLIGIAIEQGVLDGVDTALSAFFPQLADAEDTRMREVTIRHLLEHTSGIGRGDSESFEALVNSENWVEYYLSQPMSAEPGTSFHYTTAGSHMLSAVLEQAAGMSTQDYAAEHLFGPIGIESALWDADPQGITDGGNGLHLSVRDAARFGQLYLDGGSWRERQIVPQSWVALSIQAHSAGEPDKGAYGYQWWVRSFGEGGVYSGYYALGYAGQFVFVVPELELVTAVASKSVWSDYTAQVCFEEIIAATT